MSSTEYLAHEARLKKRPALTANEALECVKESVLHDQIIAECQRRRWYFVHSRMDRATTIAPGVPDFIIAVPGGITYWVEAKAKKTKVTPEQAGAIKWLGNLGHQSYVVRSFYEFQSVIDSNTK